MIPALSSEVAAYIAGMVDADGSITILPRRVYVVVSNTYLPLIDWLGQLGGHTYIYKATENPNWKPRGRWQTTNRADALAVLEQIGPHMIIKREKARQALALLRSL